MLFRVRWETDIEADSIEEAARMAVVQQMDTDPDRIDHYFEVAEVTDDGISDFVPCDLDEIDGND